MISEILKSGESEALATDTIMRITGLQSKREVVRTVSFERSGGEPILSRSTGYGGYYLASDDDQIAVEEINACIRTIESRARHTLEALKTLKEERARRIGRLSGQMNLKELTTKTTTERKNEHGIE